jgi:hypothetical protein
MELKIKTGWSEVTLEDFLMIKSILLDDNLDQFEKEVRILCLLSGVEEDYFNDYTLQEIKTVFASIAWINEEPKGDIQDIYIIAGKKYRLIKTIKDLKANQFIDLNNLISDKDEILNNLHSICAVLLLPAKKLPPKSRLFNRFLNLASSHEKGKKWIEAKGIRSILPDAGKYMDSPLDERAELIFKHLSVTQVTGITSFFFALSLLYIECLVNYSTKTMTNQFQSILKSLNEEPLLKNNQEVKILKENLQILQDLESIGDGLQ